MEHPSEDLPTNKEVSQLWDETLRTRWDQEDRQRLADKLSNLIKPIGETASPEVIWVDFGNQQSNTPE